MPTKRKPATGLAAKALKYVMILAVLALAGYLGLKLFTPQPVVSQGAVQTAVAAVTDQYGCRQPEPGAFTKLGLDFSLAAVKYQNLALGRIDVRTDPGVIDLAGKVSRDATVRDYLRCLAIHRDSFTPEQGAYLERFNAFVGATPSPTPEQFIVWQQQNPFPRQVRVTETRVVACGNLNATSSWEDDRPNQSRSCSYTAPANCIIISAPVTKNSDNNGSSAVSIAPDGRTLSATVTAARHGWALDRKRGWIDITVEALLRCET